MNEQFLPTRAKITNRVFSRPIETEHRRTPPLISYGKVTEAFERSHRVRKIIVKRVLERCKDATNNDFILQLECLREEFKDIIITSENGDINISIPLSTISKIPSAESYTRARRKLNEEGIGLPTNEYVIQMRSQREKAIREYFGNKRK